MRKQSNPTQVNGELAQAMDYPCPECGQKIVITDHQCKHCGYQRSHTISYTQYETLLKESDSDFTAKITAAIAGIEKPSKLPPGVISMYLVPCREVMTFHYTKPVLLGRGKQLRSRDMQFIDFSAYNAHTLGMSRNHALVQQVDGAYYITDLASSNGVVVNRQSLISNLSHQLENGAVVCLGKFAFAFFYG
jgi:predicted RNA-binding Zn-ribbon protein involved in translation (DUF1610 family)